jgi:pimeloyl-ACP methyl ester carboxylesterase
MTSTTAVRLSGGSLELLDLPGDPEAPVIVLLHEGLGSVGLWRKFPHHLQAATNARVLAFSRYGHGRSDPPRRPRTPDFMHEEALDVLPALLARLDIDTPVLVGHSDGASIALIHAAHHPVQAVVAIAPHVFVEQLCLAAIRESRTSYETGGLRERMARHHTDPDAAFYGWNDVWLHPEFRDWDIRPVLKDINQPLLLIQGKNDQYGTLAQLDEIEQAATGPTARVHLDCRHSPHLERRDETLQSICRFLTVTARRSAGTSPPPAARTRR